MTSDFQEDIQVAIGKTMAETKDWEWLDWWPIINEDGVITGLVSGDEDVPSYYHMVWWNHTSKTYQVTDGGNGFDAFMVI